MSVRSLKILLIIFLPWGILCWGQQKSEAGSELEKHLRLGVVFMREGHFVLAEYEFKKALVIDPQNELVIRRLGSVYILQKKYDRAIKLYKEALKSFPASVGMMNNLAVAYMEKGIFEEAIKWCKKALETQPDFCIGRLTLAEIYLKKGMINMAITEMKKAERYIQTNRDKEALENFRKLLEQKNQRK